MLDIARVQEDLRRVEREVDWFTRLTRIGATSLDRERADIFLKKATDDRQAILIDLSHRRAKRLKFFRVVAFLVPIVIFISTIGLGFLLANRTG